MKFILVLIAVFSFSFSAFARSSESASNSADHTVHGALGFTGGGLALGGEYEYRADRTYGIGGYLKLLPKDDDNGSPGVQAVGGFIRPHFHRRQWNLYVTAGFGIHSVEATPGREDESALGPAFGVGLYYQLNDTIALGVEQLSLYGWISAEDYRGLIDQNALFKMRFAL